MSLGLTTKYSKVYVLDDLVSEFLKSQWAAEKSINTAD